MWWRISLRPERHMAHFSCISQKKNKSLQLTIALYYLSIVLSTTTKQNFIPFYVWSPDLKMLQNFVCRTYGTFQYGIALHTHVYKTSLTSYSNKSPRGLNAHLNWRKLPVVHLGVCHQLEKLWGPSPGPPWGHAYHLNNSESPTPKDVFWIRWKLLFAPPPPPGPIGPPWELPWTTLILHIRRYLNTTYM